MTHVVFIFILSKLSSVLLCVKMTKYKKKHGLKSWGKYVHSSTQIRVHYGIRLLLLVTGKSSLKLIFFVGLTDLRPIFWKAGWKRLTHIFRPPQCGQKSVNKCNWKNNCSCVQLQSFGKKIDDYYITKVKKKLCRIFSLEITLLFYNNCPIWMAQSCLMTWANFFSKQTLSVPGSHQAKYGKILQVNITLFFRI